MCNEEGCQIPIGKCHCGCDGITNLAVQTCKKYGWVAGEPMKYMLYHRNNVLRLGNLPTMQYVEDDCGFKTLCWIYTTSLNSDGYGIVGHSTHYPTNCAHRIFYLLFKEDIPEGLHLDHLCRNPSCVNPDHLEPVTMTENLRRGNSTKLTKKQAEEIKLSPLSSREVAKIYGIGKSQVLRIRSGKSWYDLKSERGGVGFKAAVLKLDANKVREIKSMLNKGNKELAELYGTHPATISDIRCGKTWKNVV